MLEYNVVPSCFLQAVLHCCTGDGGTYVTISETKECTRPVLATTNLFVFTPNGTVEQAVLNVCMASASDEASCKPAGSLYAGRYTAVKDISPLTVSCCVAHESSHVISAACNFTGKMQVLDSAGYTISEQSDIINIPAADFHIQRMAVAIKDAREILSVPKGYRIVDRKVSHHNGVGIRIINNCIPELQPITFIRKHHIRLVVDDDGIVTA